MLMIYTYCNNDYEQIAYLEFNFYMHKSLIKLYATRWRL